MRNRWTSRGALMAALVGAGSLTLPLLGTAGAQVPPEDITECDQLPDTSSTTTFTCSYSTSTSSTDETVEVDQHQTRVTAVRDGTIVFDQTVDAPPESPAVQALEAQAAAALAGTGCTSTPLTVVDSGRTPTGSTPAETTEVEETVSVEHTIGNTGVTIQIGDRDTGGITFAVLPGGQNFNTHINFHTAVLLTTTNTFLNSQHRQVTGSCVAGAPPPDVAPVVVEASPVAVPVVAPPRTAG